MRNYRVKVRKYSSRWSERSQYSGATVNYYVTVFLLTCILTVSCTGKRSAGTEKTGADPEAVLFHNPIIPGDFADPSVIRVKDTYYAVGTSSEWAPHFPVFKSKDLVNWKQIAYAFDEKPSWTASSFWAPELFYHQGLFYLYYVAKRKQDGVSLIGVATSKTPENGFEDHGILIEYGKEAIDPFVFNNDGQLYITWKAYGLDDRPIELLASRLSNDGLKLEGEPFSLIKDENLRGIEGQYLIKKNNFYYLFYSEGACCGSACDYDVRIARASAIEGPYEIHEENPVLEGGGQWECPGHGTLVETGDGRSFYMYHAYRKKDDIYTGRQGLLDEIRWDQETGWPYFINGKVPSVKAALPVAGTHQQMIYSFFDDFDSMLSKKWQWDFRNAEPVMSVEQGSLTLTGSTENNNKTGTVLTVRPFLGIYEIQTAILNKNASLKGLVLYGDAHQSVGIGAINEKVQLWEVKNNERKVLEEVSFNPENPIRLRITVEEGSKCKFYWSQQEDKWNKLQMSGNAFYDGAFLPQWDRSPRLGLVHLGSIKEPARFSHFQILYRDKDGEAL